MRRVLFRAAGAAVLQLLAFASVPAHAQTAPVNVADFQDEFQAGTPRPGWRYLWNATGPLGNPTNYAPLVADNGRYESVANGTYPDAAPGSFIGRALEDIREVGVLLASHFVDLAD